MRTLNKNEIDSILKNLNDKMIDKKQVMSTIDNSEYVCLNCGCSDTRACANGCYWIDVDPKSGFGICSTNSCKKLHTEYSMIIDQKAKLNYIKNAQKENFNLIKVKIKKGWSHADKDLYLDISHLKGRKDFFIIPFKEYITNDWKHKATSSPKSMTALVEMFDIYDETVTELSQEDALQQLTNLTIKDLS